MYKSLYSESTSISNSLLTITNKCEECSIANFCETQDDFSILLKNLSAGSLELIQDSFITTPFTKKIVNTVWSPDQTLITFRKNTSILTEDECEDIIRQ